MVSVIMPVYNAELYLEDSVRSILNQTYSDIEFLIFNDGSTDNSLGILNKFANSDNRIKLFSSEENKGYLVHLNEGLKIAKGDFIARMDSDDISLPKRFEVQLSVIDNEDIDIIGSDIYYWDGKKHTNRKRSKVPHSHDELFVEMFFATPLFHPTVLFKRKLVDAGDYFYDNNFYPAEDYELWSRLLTKYKFSNITSPLLCYRISEGQISATKKSTQIKNAFHARCTYISNIIGSSLSRDEEVILYTFFYESRKSLNKEDMDILFKIFHRIVEALRNNLKTSFSKRLLKELSYLSSKNNLFYKQYYQKGFGKYFNGGLGFFLNGQMRQILK